MSHPSPDSRSVRPPTVREYPSADPAAPAPSNGSTTSVIAVVAIALVMLIGGAAGVVLLRSGGSETESTPGDNVNSGDRGDAGSVDDAPIATPEATTTELPGTTSPPDTVVAPPTQPPEPSASTTVAPNTTVAPPSAPTPAQVGAPTVVASVTRVGGIDACTPPNATSYEAGLAADGSTSTAWMAPGDGVGQRLIFSFASPVTISEVGLFPGYGKFDPCTSEDRFFQLRRIGSVQWGFDDGSVVDQTFTTEKTVQRVTIAPRVSRTVTVTIVTTIAPGITRLNHTPISEVTIS